MTKDEALKLALDWLEGGNFVYPTELRTAIKEALAQPVQEPVAWGWRYDSCGHAVVNRLVVTETPEPTLFLKNVFARGPFPLYTAPPQPEDRNFCSRCGKRTADLTTIHTCTPPLQPTIREW
jgi:hypothetical protein